MLKILNLIFVETGQYQDMLLRPYHAVVDQRNLNLMQETTQGGQNLTMGALTGVAGQVIAPMTNPQGMISIDNGWGTRRLRFVLVVETEQQFGGRTVQYLSGYTDHNDLSHSGLLDPRMRLYFNNSMLTQIITEMTPMGPQEVQRVMDASQLLMGSYSMGYGTMGHQPTTMRPMDVFASQSTAFMRDFTQRPVIDGRTNFGVDTIKKSHRQNASAPAYLSKLLQAHKATMTSADVDATDEQLMGNARGFAKEALVGEDAFLAEMMLRSSLRQNGSIQYGELIEYDRTLHDRAQVIVQQTAHQLSTGYVAQDAGEHWRGTTHETTVATILSHAVPGLMMDLMLNKIAFSATNMTPGNQIDIKLTGIPYGFANVDPEPQVQQFFQMLRFQLLNDISMGNKMSYEIHAQVDVVGDSQFQISMNGSPLTPYVVPSFSDARFAPVLAANPQTLHDLSTSIIGLADRLNMDHSVQTVHGNAVNSYNTQMGNTNDGYLGVL